MEETEAKVLPISENREEVLEGFQNIPHLFTFGNIEEELKALNAGRAADPSLLFLHRRTLQVRSGRIGRREESSFFNHDDNRGGMSHDGMLRGALRILRL